MKIVLRITDTECASAKLAAQILRALEQSRDFFPSLRHWGEYHGKKKDLGSLPDLPVLQKLKPGNYALSDVEEGEGAAELRVSFRKEIVSLRLYREVAPQNLEKECETLTEYFKQLYAELRDTVTFPLVSSITALDLEYPQPRPPRVWNAFDPLGIVDFINPSQAELPDTKRMTESLVKAPLPAGAQRKSMEDLVLVNWLPLREDTLEKKLSRRCVWYYENGDLQRDPTFNEQGDGRVAVFENQKTQELTFYDAATQTGYKAIGFDPKDKSYETDKVQRLEKLLQKGSVEGHPLAKGYLVVSKREFAILLCPVAREHRLEGVLYADNAGQLWDPFPEGNWLN